MTEDELIGTQLDEYKLEALLGEGGMARVYRGRDMYLQRLAAIKVIVPTFRQEHDYLERFEREARAIATLEHPHIVRLYRYGEAQGLVYMAMQFVEGSDLDRVLRSYRQSNEYIEFPEAIRLIREIGTALDYVHTQGIIHRDVKSSNIMLDQAGKAYLTDFGLVLLTEIGTRGEIFGSPHYLAPEQAISSAKAVPQSDLYSLGVIAWEMFTGQVPFDAQDPLDIAMMHMSQEPPLPRSLRPELPSALEAVLLKALAKKPEDRYPSGAELAAAIEAALAAPIAETRPMPSFGKTIPERVALDMADWPLPPIPAAAISQSETSPSEISPPESSVTEQAFTAPVQIPPTEAAPITQLGFQTEAPAVAAPREIPRRVLIVSSLAVILGLCLLAGCLIVFNLSQGGFAGLQGSSPDPVITLSTTETDESLSVFPLPGEAATPSATSLPATPTPDALPTVEPSPLPQEASIPIAATVTLAIVRCDEGHCLGIINQGPAALPLGGLVIKGKGYSYSGTDWGLADLPPSGCLVLTGNASKWLPSRENCSSAVATFISAEDFWKRKLEVAYAGKSYGSCSEDSDYCEFLITIK